MKTAYDSSTLLSDLLSAGTAGVAGAARRLPAMDRAKGREAMDEGKSALRTIINEVPPNDLETGDMLRRYAVEKRDEARGHYAKADSPGRKAQGYGSSAGNALAEAFRPVGDHHVATPLASIVGQLAATGLLQRLAPSAGLAAHGAASAGGALAARLGLRGYDALSDSNDPTLALKSVTEE